MNKQDAFAMKMFQKDGYNVTYRIHSKLEITKNKPHAMRVYVHILGGIEEPHKIMVRVLNFTDSSDYKEIFDRYDGKVFEFEQPLTKIPDCDIMEPIVENVTGTLESLFS
jgi:hypothetical protein